jgi:hypothetical protein
VRDAITVRSSPLAKLASPWGMWTLLRIYPGVLASYPQSVDAYADRKRRCVNPAKPRAATNTGYGAVALRATPSILRVVRMEEHGPETSRGRQPHYPQIIHRFWHRDRKPPGSACPIARQPAVAVTGYAVGHEYPLMPLVRAAAAGIAAVTALASARGQPAPGAGKPISLDCCCGRGWQVPVSRDFLTGHRSLLR